MTRNLKTLGLALVAAFAMSAVVASAAQAQKPTVITTETGEPVTITGTGVTGANQPTLTRAGRSVTCAHDTLHGDAANHASTIDLKPEYTACTNSVGGPATITNTGCFYRFHLRSDEPEPGKDTFTATAGLHCEPGKHIVIHAYLSASQHAEKPTEPSCQYTFTDRNAAGEGTKQNQNLEHIDFTNEPASETTPKNWVMAHATLKGIVSTRTRGSALLCGPELDAAGELHGTYRLKGDVKNGSEPLGVTISTTE